MNYLLYNYFFDAIYAYTYSIDTDDFILKFIPIKSYSFNPFSFIIQSNSSAFIVSCVFIIILNFPVNVNIESSFDGIAIITSPKVIKIYESVGYTSSSFY